MKRLKAIFFLVPVLLLSLLVSSCDQAGSNSQPGQLTITTTTGMIGDVVRRIAGERAVVQVIIGEGVDPHLYKPTSVDVKKLQTSDMVFYNGLMLEGKMGDILRKLAEQGKPVHAVSAGLEKQEGYVIPQEENHADPHIWMDVAGWLHVVDYIGAQLEALDPTHAAEYQVRKASYVKELQALDAYAKTVIASIPAERRVLVTAHDAFGYLSRAYGIEVRGIQGFSTESEAGLKDIESLVSFLVERKIPAVFVESSVSQKNIKALIEGAKAQGHVVTIGGELFSDAMGPSGDYTGTYIGMIDHNVTTIAKALGGTAPEKGMNGKLP